MNDETKKLTEKEMKLLKEYKEHVENKTGLPIPKCLYGCIDTHGEPMFIAKKNISQEEQKEINNYYELYYGEYSSFDTFVANICGPTCSGRYIDGSEL